MSQAGGVPQSLARVLMSIEEAGIPMSSSEAQIRAMVALENPGISYRNEPARVYTVVNESDRPCLVAIYLGHQEIPGGEGWTHVRAVVVGGECSNYECFSSFDATGSKGPLCTHLLSALSLADHGGIQMGEAD